MSMTKVANEYYQAVLARDHRFDGKFFVGVKTTGIYCRPICPARPKRENVEFFDSKERAEQAGYRPCLRCRPEAAPLSPAWYGKSALVQRALRRLIDVGMQEESEDEFASHFGVTARHLRRLFQKELGKTPHQFEKEQRLNLARKLIVETQLPVTEIAYASGFQSLRRFQDAFQKRFDRPPTKLRKSSAAVLRSPTHHNQTTLWLSYRPPFRWEALLSYLARHEVYGVEEISSARYVRYCKIKEGISRLTVENHPHKCALLATLDGFEQDSLYRMIQGIRRLFDLDADPLLISMTFERSKPFQKLDQAFLGSRSPGAFDAFETAICIILGQLVSNLQARRLTAKLVEQYGEAHWFEGKRVFSFPTPGKLAAADLSQLPTTQKRREALTLFSQKIDRGEIQLSPHLDVRKLKAQLLAIPGIGPWTVEYIGMRCLSDPDSFPASDLILKRVCKAQPHLNLDQVRPFRSYAAYLLWEAGLKMKEQPKEQLL